MLNYCVIFNLFCFIVCFETYLWYRLNTHWRAKPIRTYMPVYTIFQFDDRHLFFILYIKIHAQYHSFLYVSFQSWFTWFWWLRIVTFDWSYRNKKKSVQFFVNTVTFYLHYVVFVFINKKKNIWLSRCYWVLFVVI